MDRLGARAAATWHNPNAAAASTISRSLVCGRDPASSAPAMEPIASMTLKTA
jgi:hypothetical protein